MGYNDGGAMVVPLGLVANEFFDPRASLWLATCGAFGSIMGQCDARYPPNTVAIICSILAIVTCCPSICGGTISHPQFSNR